MAEEQTGGDIVVRWEPPDLLFLIYSGHLTAPHIEGAVATSKRLIAAQPYHMAMLDVSKLRGMTLGARKAAVASSDTMNVRGVAVIGASFHLKVLGNLLGRAAQLVYPAKDNPLEFFSSEAEARAWIHGRRGRLEKEYPAERTSGQ